MNTDIQNILKKIHSSPSQAAIISTGGAGQALAWLLGLPGSSRTILEISAPYGKGSIEEELGYKPGKFVTVVVAQQLATRAYNRAKKLTAGRPIGLGCTASLATIHPKRGNHRVVIAVRSPEEFTTYNLTLSKGKRDRSAEDHLASLLLIQALAKAAGLKDSVKLNLLEGEVVKTMEHPYPSPLTKILAGNIKTLLVEPDGKWLNPAPKITALLAGAFNPWHEGHRRLAHAAAKFLKTEIILELSVVNVDKPPLETTEVHRRLAQFAWRKRVILTHAATFLEKADLFPGCTFVVGYDTADRMVAPHYYKKGVTMQDALRYLRRLGCKFLVAPRLYKGKLKKIDQLIIPENFKDLFDPLLNFRFDMSSTNLKIKEKSINEIEG